MEIGIGSGVISITLLNNIKNLSMVATDISKEIIEIAQRNYISIVNGGKAKLNFLLCENENEYEVLEPFYRFGIENNKVDFLIACPPYLVSSDDISDKFITQPALALYASNNNPLYFYLPLAREGHKFLKPEGFMLLECRTREIPKLIELFSDEGYDIEVIFKKDIKEFPQ